MQSECILAGLELADTAEGVLGIPGLELGRNIVAAHDSSAVVALVGCWVRSSEVRRRAGLDTAVP